MSQTYKIMLVVECDARTDENWRKHHLPREFVGVDEFQAQAKATQAGWRVYGGTTLCPDCVAKMSSLGGDDDDD